MKCFKCRKSIQDKKFKHPILDEWLCCSCFESKIDANRTTLNSSFGKLQDNYSEAGIKDDLNLGFVLCSAGANRNKDGFDAEDLSTDHKTAENQRIDWEHGSETVGVITTAEYVDEDDRKEELQVELDRPFIYTQGLLWRPMNNSRASEVIKRYREGSLFYSMEDYFDYVQCSECGEEYTWANEYCDHLQNRHKPNATAHRILKGNKFVGAGVVKQPADRDAVGYAVAKLNKARIIAQLLNPDLLDYYKFCKARGL